MFAGLVTSSASRLSVPHARRIAVWGARRSDDVARAIEDRGAASPRGRALRTGHASRDRPRRSPARRATRAGSRGTAAELPDGPRSGPSSALPPATARRRTGRTDDAARCVGDGRGRGSSPGSRLASTPSPSGGIAGGLHTAPSSPHGHRKCRTRGGLGARPRRTIPDSKSVQVSTKSKCRCQGAGCQDGCRVLGASLAAPWLIHQWRI